MTREEIELALRVLAGHWPQPEIGEDEVIVWTNMLWPLDYATTVQAVERVARSGRLHWRPTASEIYGEYKDLVREQRLRTRPPALSESALASPETVRRALDQMFACLGRKPRQNWGGAGADTAT